MTPLRNILIAGVLLAVATVLPMPVYAVSEIATLSARTVYGVLASLNLTTAAAGTYSSPAQTGYGSNLTCTYAQTASASSPSTTIAVQGEVSGTTNWVTFITSTAVTTGVTAVSITLGPAILSGTNQLNTVVPQPWRASLVTAGGTITGAVSCAGQD
jgi:hypothetical protein